MVESQCNDGKRGLSDGAKTASQLVKPVRPGCIHAYPEHRVLGRNMPVKAIGMDQQRQGLAGGKEIMDGIHVWPYLCRVQAGVDMMQMT